jgi:dTDP-4-dehydrorhamnose reductase
MVLKCKRILPVKSDCFPALAPRPIYSVLSTKKYEQEIEKPRSWKKALQEYLYEST